MWFRCLGLICDLIGVGFDGVGLICDLWLWVCFMVFCGLFNGGCGFVGGGYVVLALDCVFFFFWFSYWGLWLWLMGRQWGGVCGSVRVGSRSVGGSMGLLPGFFFFGVDSRLWVGGGGGVKCV